MAAEQSALGTSASPRTRQMPARFLWPLDVVLIDGRQRELTRVEITTDSVTIFAGGAGRPLPADTLVDVVITSRSASSVPAAPALRLVAEPA